MTTIQIENGIPAPYKPNWRTHLNRMEINQCARIDIKYQSSVKAIISQYFHHTTEKVFTTAKEPGGHFRVWRIK